MNPEDQVFLLHDGWYAMVVDRTFGPWPCKEYALAGLATEQQRLQSRSAT